MKSSKLRVFLLAASFFAFSATFAQDTTNKPKPDTSKSPKPDTTKIEAPKGWTKYSNIWGTNESGFTALAGSCRLFNGTFGDPGLFSTGFWWTAASYPGNQAWYRYLDYKNANVFRSHTQKNYGFSIRCVKD